MFRKILTSSIVSLLAILQLSTISYADDSLVSVNNAGEIDSIPLSGQTSVAPQEATESATPSVEFDINSLPEKSPNDNEISTAAILGTKDTRKKVLNSSTKTPYQRIVYLQSG